MTHSHHNRSCVAGLLALLATFVVVSAAIPVGAGRASRAHSSSAAGPLPTSAVALDDLPISFVSNAGQADRSVRFVGQAPGFGAFFRDDRIVLAFDRPGGAETLHLVPVAPSPDARLEALERVRGRVTFVRPTGSMQVEPFRAVAYRDLWPGIDMVLRAGVGVIKYEFHVAPGADAGSIRLAYEGVDALTTGTRGELVVDTPLGQLRDPRPRTFQRIHGERVRLPSGYAVDPTHKTYGFQVGPVADPHRPVIIDPGLDYSTYLGGGTNDIGIDVAVDRAGNAYVTGATRSAADFPTTPGVVDSTYNNDPAAVDVRDMYVAKLNRKGTGLVYSTYIGGSGAESGQGIAVDDRGSAYVSGGTGSSDFPTTPGAFDPTHNNYEDAFVVKLNPSGSAVEYATVIGGGSVEGEFAPGIAVDGRGHAFVTGGTGSPEFPVTDGAFDTTHDGALDVFVAELDPTGSELLYSTLLGGAANDVGFRIALRNGETYVTGDASSQDFPTTKDAFERRPGGGGDAFVARIRPGAGDRLVYSTLLGGSGPDFGRGIAVTRSGATLVSGGTSSPDFPTTKSAFERRHGGDEDGFVVELNGTGSRLGYSTFLGGSMRDRANAVKVTRAGAAFVAGDTESADFPTTGRAFQRQLRGRQDAFVSLIVPQASGLRYSTYLGGSSVDFGRGLAIDDDGGVYITGRTGSNNFPTTGAEYDPEANGGLDGFVSKFVGFGDDASSR